MSPLANLWSAKFLASGRYVVVIGSALLLSGAAMGEEILPREPAQSALFRTGDAEPSSYVLLEPGEGASYVFCGQGEIRVQSRALLPRGVSAARYFIDLRIDGDPVARELAYRSYALEDAFFDSVTAGRRGAASLRRTRIPVARGCHSVRLDLTRSTTPSVALRFVFKSKKTTKRAFEASALTGGRPVEVVLPKSRTSYRAVDIGQRAELTVEGPAWVRLLSRPMSRDEPDVYELVVEDGAEPFRAFAIENAPSRRARIEGQRQTRVGSAREVVFAVDEGSHRLHIGPGADVAVALRALVAPRDPSRPVAGEREWGWSTRARVASYYDDNILRYSDKFIQRFENGEDPGRFRVESLDDIIHRADLDLERTFEGLGGRRASFSLGLTHRAYQRNSIKDWSQGRVEWFQSLARGRSVTFFANASTDFYVRHLRDGDLVGRGSTSDPFQAFEFKKNEAGLRYSQELGALWNVVPEISYATFRHSQAFREFDSENVRARVRFNQRLNRRVRLSYAVEYTESDAQGYDEPGETLETSDDSDPSYRQIDLMLAARFALPFARNQVLFFQAEAGDREYTTSKPKALAPFHNGREDELLRIYASWQIDLTERLQLTVFGQYRDRSSSIPEDLDIGLDKNYEQYEAGIRLTARWD